MGLPFASAGLGAESVGLGTASVAGLLGRSLLTLLLSCALDAGVRLQSDSLLCVESGTRIAAVSLSGAAVLLFMMLSLEAKVFAAKDEDFQYEIIFEKAVITRYNGNAANLVIPESLGGRPVIEIGHYAFRDQIELLYNRSPLSESYSNNSRYLV